MAHVRPKIKRWSKVADEIVVVELKDEKEVVNEICLRLNKKQGRLMGPDQFADLFPNTLDWDELIAALTHLKHLHDIKLITHGVYNNAHAVIMENRDYLP